MKTKVTIIKDVENSQVKKGETGYIDGYATDLNEVMTELKYSSVVFIFIKLIMIVLYV